MLKDRGIPHNFRVLTAGSQREILSFIPHLEKYFKDAPQIDETNVAVLLIDALNHRKREKVEEYVQGQYAITYDEFKDIGKDKFPADLYREALGKISRIKIDASCIVGGFYYGQFPLLVTADENSRVTIAEDFAIIGEGEYLAAASLLQREHSDVNDLASTIYAVYEAKKLAERVGSVGRYTTISIMYPNGTLGRVNTDGKNYLDQVYQKYGPQRLQPLVFNDDEFLDRSDGPTWPVRGALPGPKL